MASGVSKRRGPNNQRRIIMSHKNGILTTNYLHFVHKYMRTLNWCVAFIWNNALLRRSEITVFMALICSKILSLCIVNDKERRGGVLIQVADVVYPFRPQLLTHQTLFMLYSVCTKRVIFVITRNIKKKGPYGHIHIFATRQHLPSCLFVFHTTAFSFTGLHAREFLEQDENKIASNVVYCLRL
jgi:hypothetical protein